MFGQLPKKVIYRQIEEQKGISLADYINRRLEQWKETPDAKRVAAMSAQGAEDRSEVNLSRPNSHLTSRSRKENVKISQRTLFTEYEAIDIAIKIIDLLEILH